MSRRIKNQKNKPISKELITKCNWYIPYFTNEKEWERININNWFEILYYNYNIDSRSNYKIDINSRICSIDIGVKNFITLYGLNGYCYKIKSSYNQINIILKNNNIPYSIKDKMIREMINELHIISAKYICKLYDIIYIGYVNNKGNIDSSSMETIEDNLLKIVCHNKFLELLKVYCIQYKKELYIVDESYTSVMCGSCSNMNKFDRIIHEDGSIRRMYICKYCNVISCRDMNASRNILIKNYAIN
jgi:transposase